MGVPLRVETNEGSEITTSPMREAPSPHHKPRRTSRVFGVFSAYNDMMPLANNLLRRIRAIRVQENCGAVIMGWIENRQMPVTILSMGSLGTDAAVRGNPALVVGYYANNERKATDPDPRSPEWQSRIYPTPESLLQDLAQHAMDLGMLSDADLYGDLRYAEDA